MANDLVIKLLLKTGAFSQDLTKAKGQIQTFQKGCNAASNSVAGFAKGLGINIGTLAKFGTAAGAAALVADTLAKSLKTNADIMDRFNRVMEQAKAHMQSFFHSIGSGNFKEFITNWKQVSESAGRYADMVDEAGSRNATLNAMLSVTHTRYEELVAKARDVGNSDKERLGYLAAANSLLLEEVAIREKLAKNEERLLLANMQKALNANGANFSFDEVGDVVQLNKLLQIDENGVWGFELEENLTTAFLKQLAEALKDMENNDETRKILTDYWKNIINKLDQKSIEAFKAEQQKILNQAGARVSGSGDSLENVMKYSTKYFEDNISKLEKERDAVEIGSSAYRRLTIEIKKLNEEYQRYIDKVTSIEKFDDSFLPKPVATVQNPNGLAGSRPVSQSTGDYTPQKSLEEMKILADNLYSALDSVNNMFYALGDAARSLGSDAGDSFANILDTLGIVSSGIQDFIKIQQAAAMANGVASASAMQFPYNLAAIASVVATIASVFAKIKSTSSGKFANGGIVPGTSYTGDRLSANVNSGEMILNRTQQSNLFRQINSGRNGGGNQVEFHISGTDLVGVLNNNNRKSRLVR